MRGDAVIWPQGPYANVPAGLAAAGQTITSDQQLDLVRVVQLAYHHEGSPWWQVHCVTAYGKSGFLVVSGQAPAVSSAETLRAALAALDISVPDERTGRHNHP